jgi:hypothetical protein
MVLLTCPECGRGCKNPSGLTRHRNFAHKHDPGLNIPVTELQRVYHPHLHGASEQLTSAFISDPVKGLRCDQYGAPLAPSPLPEPPTAQANNDWSPFTSRAGFELADFLFNEAELSQKKVDRLLEIWAATLVPHDDIPPISNHHHLHRQIDAVKLGDVKWENTILKYNGPPPETTRPPEWKTMEYDVWYRNPREVIRTILSNPDFDGHIDYSPYQEFKEGKRQYSNMMSGDWAWRQCVNYFPPC